MLLRLFLIFSISIFGIWLLRARKTARVRAWQKLIIIIFVLTVILVTLSPRLSTQLALFFGLNRATDVIVYATIIILLFVTANIYLKFQDMHNQLVKIARKTAIQEALIQNPEWTKEK
ncbi:MAG: DUF2304 domain-containing protein [Actinomycetes bacterium]